MAIITENLQAVHDRIRQAAAAANRAPDSVRLLAVSKTFGASAVVTAWQAGQRAFGENFVQEALDKIAELGHPDIEWHFIGPLQSNKTRSVAENFDWVHAVDREKIAQRLSDQRPSTLPPLNICLQVNVSGEATKSGVAPEALPELARAVSQLPRLKLRGLMAIPEPAETEEAQRKPFAQLRQLQQELAALGIDTDTLSMGMSSDMPAAIAEGATIVRIGTAIFGKRTYAN